MKKLFKALLHVIRFFALSILFMSLLFTGMAVGGFYLLDYLVSGTEVEVPNLYGKTKTECLEILAQHELLLALPVEEYPSPDTPSGVVIEQRPNPGARVKKHRSISLVVSVGPEQLYIPELTGRSEADIYPELRSAGLEIGQRASVYHPAYAKGTIIAQDPLPGNRIVHGKKIHILVSLGPWPVSYVMPALTGMDLTTARKRVQETALSLSSENIKYQPVLNESQWNRVLDQNPPPGTKVLENEDISVVVGSRPPAPTPIPILEIPMEAPLEADRPTDSSPGS
ncbi:MAG TPA: PASTA domain-containing protein [bacterium]|nr:PASTA domain-containing protein [bacterium]HPP01834.1 PASTA domain-containing protein [bacterium]HXK93114.1 PASTA domain-containing protein [bacterium]